MDNIHIISFIWIFRFHAHLLSAIIVAYSLPQLLLMIPHRSGRTLIKAGTDVVYKDAFGNICSYLGVMWKYYMLQ